jgi:hypothetical protein
LWPHYVNFGDLCYSSSDEVEVEIGWRYMNATKEKHEQNVSVGVGS